MSLVGCRMQADPQFAPLSEGLMVANLAHRPPIVATLAPRQEEIRLLGGSNAQRDIVMQSLIAGPTWSIR
jgi:hypothetical protein